MKSLVTLALLILGWTQTFACECDGGPSSVLEAYENTETIVHGCVSEISIVSLENTMDHNKVNSLRENLKGDNQKLDLLEGNLIIEIQLDRRCKYSASKIIKPL